MKRSSFLRTMVAATLVGFMDVKALVPKFEFTSVEDVSDITGLIHEIYMGDVLPAVRWDSVGTTLFAEQEAARGDGLAFTVDTKL